MRIVIAPDKFKGSLTAFEAADAMAAGARAALPGAVLTLVPMADGGEGTVDALVAATGGRLLEAAVTGPRGATVRARYGLLGDGHTAVVEMAAASGLVLLDPPLRDPFLTTTQGTGELIAHALKRPEVRRVIVGIGGSATNDGGAGMAQALGYRFLDDRGQILDVHGAGALRRIARIDPSGRLPALDRTRVDIACDVDNPLVGERGAAAVFGAQKFDPARPARPEQIRELDDALVHLARLIERDLGIPVAELPGAGAAGGLGAGLVAFAGGRITPGAALVIDAVNLRAQLDTADLCLTGEGAIDASTAAGKTVAAVGRLARDLHVPAIALAGQIAKGAELLLNEGVNAHFGICGRPMTLEDAMRDARTLLTKAAEQTVRAFLAGRAPEQP